MTEIKEYQKKICLIGDGAVGKTSLIRRYVLDVYNDDYIMTMGTKVSRKEMRYEYPDSDKIISLNLMIWDIMGQQEFQRLQDMAYEGANGALVVSDFTRKETLHNIELWVPSLLKIAGEIPIIFLINKADLVDEKQISESDINEVCEKYGSEYLFTSAKSGENVEKAFEMIGKKMLQLG